MSQLLKVFQKWGLTYILFLQFILKKNLACLKENPGLRNLVWTFASCKSKHQTKVYIPRVQYMWIAVLNMKGSFFDSLWYILHAWRKVQYVILNVFLYFWRHSRQFSHQWIYSIAEIKIQISDDRLTWFYFRYGK